MIILLLLIEDAGIKKNNCYLEAALHVLYTSAVSHSVFKIENR